MDARLHEIFNLLPHGILILKSIKAQNGEIVDFEISLVNKAAETPLEIKQDDLVGKRMIGDTKIKGGFKFYTLSKQVLEQNEPQKQTCLFESDLAGWYEVYADRMDEDEILIVFYDVSDRFNIDEERNKCKEILRESQHMGHIGSYDWNIIEDNIEWTDESYKLYGYKVGEKINHQKVLNAINPADRQKIQEALVLSFKYDIPFDFEFRTLFTNKIIRTSGNVFFDENKNPIRMKGFSVDLTQRRNVENELQNAKVDLEAKVRERTLKLLEDNEKLVKQNKDLDMFVYSASHDLKSPINNIEGLLESLVQELPEECVKSENVASVLQMLQISVEKFKDSISELATVGRVNSEALQEINFHDLVNEIKLSLITEIEKAQPVFKEYFEVDNIYFSRRDLRSVLLNLISNAIKYRSPEKQLSIEVTTEAIDGNVHLKIKDNGIGINKEDRDKIFQMYRRAHHHVEGTGLGMALVVRIVEKIGGKIKVDSEPNEGTTFTLVLPEQKEVIPEVIA